MNWDAIGAVGETIGALAVVVTLAYLALQVRASTRESEANAFTVTGGDRSMIRGRFMERADIWAMGNSKGQLSPSERIVFDELVMSRADHHFFAFARSLLRGSGSEKLHVSALARFLYEHPAAYASWRSDEHPGRQTWALGRLGAWALGRRDAAAFRTRPVRHGDRSGIEFAERLVSMLYVKVGRLKAMGIEMCSMATTCALSSTDSGMNPASGYFLAK